MNISEKQNRFYLKHSFRKAGKVITKEVYLGNKIPKNIEKIKSKLKKEILEITVFKKLKLIQKNFKKEWKKLPKSIKKKVLIDFSVDFTYNSNAIENSTITLHETEELIKKKIAPNKKLDDIQETINHSKVFLKAIFEKRISSKSIKNWHEELFKNSKQDIAGKIREHMIRVGPYIAPDWQDLPELLHAFFKGFAQERIKKLNPVEFVARAHYKFEKIHPFGDGNGRIGRIIIANILKQNNYPLIIIEYKNRKSYYHALNKSENEFVSYFFRRYIKFNKKYLN